MTHRDYGNDVRQAVESHHIAPGREYPYQEFLRRAGLVKPHGISTLQMHCAANRDCPWRVRVRRQWRKVVVWLERKAPRGQE